MAGTDITNLLEIIQRKIDAADGNTATKDLLYLLSAVRKGDGTALELYDSSGAFPDLTDSDADKEMIAYKLDSDRLYFNVGVWKGKSLPAGGGGAAYSFQGSNFGYASGGQTPTASNVIDKFPFSSDANASDVGDLTLARAQSAGQSSTVSGYTSGGFPDVGTGTIDKFPFASDANASDVGDLTEARIYPAGQSSSENGYASGGNPSAPGAPPASNVIDKFPFASDANSSDVGDLTVARKALAGQSSTTHGYSSGGDLPGVGYLNTIDKFPFTSDANSSDVGDLTVARSSPAGQSSSESGYTSGGLDPGIVKRDIIDKFPFASDANASDVGDLTGARYFFTGQSSTTNGYVSGDYPESNVIDKFPFATDANASDVGDLTLARRSPAGQQY
jgi:hypothetical protein